MKYELRTLPEIDKKIYVSIWEIDEDNNHRLLKSTHPHPNKSCYKWIHHRDDRLYKIAYSKVEE